MLIIRRSNCVNTASGIVLSVSDRPVCRCSGVGVHVRTPSGVQVFRCWCAGAYTGRSLTENTIPDAVLI